MLGYPQELLLTIADPALYIKDSDEKGSLIVLQIWLQNVRQRLLNFSNRLLAGCMFRLHQDKRLLK